MSSECPQHLASRTHQTAGEIPEGGEILWILGALSVVQMLALYLFIQLFQASYLWYTGFRLSMGLFVWFPAYLYALYCSRGYWRVFFVLLVAANLGCYFFQNVLAGYGGVRAMYIGTLLQMAFVASVLAVVALIDLRRRDKRYPWPHWVGILLELSSRVVWAAIYIVILCTKSLP